MAKCKEGVSIFPPSCYVLKLKVVRFNISFYFERMYLFWQRIMRI